VVEGGCLNVDIGLIVLFFMAKFYWQSPFQPNKRATSFFLLAQEERSKKGGPFIFNSLIFSFFYFTFGKVLFSLSVCNYLKAVTIG
jgi:hypothetical protein